MVARGRLMPSATMVAVSMVWKTRKWGAGCMVKALGVVGRAGQGTPWQTRGAASNPVPPCSRLHCWVLSPEASAAAAGAIRSARPWRPTETEPRESESGLRSGSHGRVGGVVGVVGRGSPQLADRVDRRLPGCGRRACASPAEGGIGRSPEDSTSVSVTSSMVRPDESRSSTSHSLGVSGLRTGRRPSCPPAPRAAGR